jgi:hypothetical protein
MLLEVFFLDATHVELHVIVVSVLAGDWPRQTMHVGRDTFKRC